MKYLNLIKVPVEASNGISGLEQRSRQVVPCDGIPSHDAIDDGVGQQLRVTQRIGYAVRCERIFEIASIANKRPARPMRLSQEYTSPAENAQWSIRLDAGNQVSQSRIRLTE